MNSTTSILDLAPCLVIMNCLASISPHVTFIVNLSLSSGTNSRIKNSCHYDSLNRTEYVPRKPGCDVFDLSNYRPISNLLCVVAFQLSHHLSLNSLFEPFQSEFRKGHNTETTLVGVVNDLLIAADSGACSILVLLDLSAAFDTICHSLLLDRLENWLGVSGAVFSCLSAGSNFI